MSKTEINIQIDEDLKKEATELFDSLGMSLPAAINIFLKQSVREKGLPFELKFNKETQQAFLEAENNDLKTFNNVDELWEYLNDN